MQIFKGRDAQQLEKLAAAPSSWRVLNLHNATRALHGAGGSTQRRFFQTHQLNNALFTKHTLREHERSVFAVPPAVATKILIPLDRASFSHGAMAIFVGERGYEAAMRQWLGLKVGPSLGMTLAANDAAILAQLSELSSFDPFLLSETFGDGALGVSADYLRVSLIDDAMTKAFILREVTPLIHIAAGNPSTAKVHKFVDSIFGRDLGPAAADFLHSLGLPESRWAAIVSAWKAALRYEAEFPQTTASFQQFTRQVSELSTYGYSERVSRAEVDATTLRTREFVKRIFGNLLDAAQGFNSGRRAAIIEDKRVGELKTYLEELPDAIAAYANVRAIAQHALSYWEFRTRGLAHTWMPAEPFCRLANDLFAMEVQYASAQFSAARDLSGFDLRKALTTL